MRQIFCFSLVFLAAACSNCVLGEQTNSTSKSLYTYSGTLLPPDWSLVTILDERAVIGFSNGSARNSLLRDLEPKDRIFLEKLQNGTLSQNPLDTAKIKISQWSSSVSSGVSKLSKSLKDQLDTFLSKNKDPSFSNVTSTTTIIE